MVTIADVLDSLGPKLMPLPNVAEIPFVPNKSLNIGHDNENRNVLRYETPGKVKDSRCNVTNRPLHQCVGSA